jgi:hypothetical protein
MNERESDPTGAFRGGSAGLEDDPATTTEYERHAPEGSERGGGQPNSGRAGANDQAGGGDARSSVAEGVDETEREVITSGTAATSEIGDPQAQAQAEGQGDGTPQPR